MIGFEDKPLFTPCYTPTEMFKLGIFGGSYFQLETHLPQGFLEETRGLFLYNSKPDKRVNAFGILSGSSLEWWTQQNLIHLDDPNGWVEWYVKFYWGRRHEDDDRQIQRFRSFIARHLGMLRSYEIKGKTSIKTNQNLLQWAWDYKIDSNW